MKRLDPNDVKNVLPNIAAFDAIQNGMNGIQPINGILHSIDSLTQYDSDFKNVICPKLSVPPQGYSWQVGIYPMLQKDVNGQQRMGLYFIPTLARNGFDTLAANDTRSADIRDYRMDANRLKYNEGIVYVEDLGTSWP